jgi:hypothetical protein
MRRTLRKVLPRSLPFGVQIERNFRGFGVILRP